MVQQRAFDQGVHDKVRVHLCDYRELPASFEHAFDALVTCEMIEVRHVLYCRLPVSDGHVLA